MTRTDLSQNALPAIRPAQDTLGGAGSGTDSPAPPPAPSSPSPVPRTHARGAPSTDAPKTRQTILREHERNDIDSGDRSLDDGTHQFILDTLRTNWDDSDDETDAPNLPMLTTNDLPNLPISPKSLTRGCPNAHIPQNAPQSFPCAQPHHGFHFGGYDGADSQSESRENIGTAILRDSAKNLTMSKRQQRKIEKRVNTISIGMDTKSPSTQGVLQRGSRSSTNSG